MTCAGVNVTPAATGIRTGGFGVPKSRPPRVVPDEGVYATTVLQMPSPIGLIENCVKIPSALRSPFTQILLPTEGDALVVGPDPEASAKFAVPSAIDPAAVADGAAYAVTVPHGHLKNPEVGGVVVRVGAVVGAGVDAIVVGGALVGPGVAAGAATQLVIRTAARTSASTDARSCRRLFTDLSAEP